MIYMIFMCAALTLSNDAICSHLLSRVKMPKLSARLARTTLRARNIPKRTLVYQLWAPKYGLTKTNPLLKEFAASSQACAPETKPGFMPPLAALYNNRLYFAHIAMPDREWPHYYAFDSKSDIEKIVSAADPAQPTASCPIEGIATIGAFDGQSFPLLKTPYDSTSLYAYFNAQSYEARIHWYAIGKSRIKEDK